MKPLDLAEVVARLGAVLRSKKDADRRIAHERDLMATTRSHRRRQSPLVRSDADRIWRSASRHQLELAVVMIDIDCFKDYNDSLGHPAGDACLRRLAGGLTNTLRRPDDFLARYGGEEFVILPQTDMADAAAVAERLRGSIEALGIGHPASPLANHLTISLGVASILPTREAARFTLISMADEVLYRAKRSGRNRVSTLAESYQRTLSGFAAGQSHNRTPKPAELFEHRLKPQ